MNSIYNPNGKIYEIDHACPMCWIFGGMAGFAISLVLLILNTGWFIISVVVAVVSAWFLIDGIKNKNKNTKYIIDSKNDTFFVPLEDAPYCKLSDIDKINKRQESSKTRESYREDGKTKYRTVINYTYYVQIIGENISTDFSFSSQGNRDRLYCSLQAGVDSIKKFMRK